MPDFGKSNYVLGQPQAESLAQNLNHLMYNCALYGIKHPATIEMIVGFLNKTQELFAYIPGFSLYRIQESMYVEKWCVNSVMNAPRLAASFKRIGLTSVIFNAGITQHEFEHFAEAFSHIDSFHSIEELKAILISGEIKSILLEGFDTVQKKNPESKEYIHTHHNTQQAAPASRLDPDLQKGDARRQQVSVSGGSSGNSLPPVEKKNLQQQDDKSIPGPENPQPPNNQQQIQQTPLNYGNKDDGTGQINNIIPKGALTDPIQENHVQKSEWNSSPLPDENGAVVRISSSEQIVNPSGNGATDIRSASVNAEPTPVKTSELSVQQPPQTQLQRLVASPDEYIAELVTLISDPANTMAFLEEIRCLKHQIRNAVHQEEKVPLDSIFESAYKLSYSVNQIFAKRKSDDSQSAVAGAVRTETDSLTNAVLCLYGRAVYKQGVLSNKRLVQMVHSVLLEKKEKNDLVALLHSELSGVGMSPIQFLSLVAEVCKELKYEGLLSVLHDGSEIPGFSVDEVTKRARNHTEEVAGLMICVADILQIMTADPGKRTMKLLEYIEVLGRVSAVRSFLPDATCDTQSLRNILKHEYRYLISVLKPHIPDASIISSLRKEIDDRFEESLSLLEMEWLSRFLQENRFEPLQECIKHACTFIRNCDRLTEFEQHVRSAVTDETGSCSVPDNFFVSIRGFLQREESSVPMPKSILTARNTYFFIQWKIKENLRYSTPFSCALFSVVNAYKDGVIHELTPLEHKKVIVAVAAKLRKMIRGIDLIGSFGSINEQTLLLLLPVTDAKGAASLKERIRKVIPQWQCALKGGSLTLSLAITILFFNQQDTPDYKSFQELLIKTHSEEEERIRKEPIPPAAAKSEGEKQN